MLPGETGKGVEEAEQRRGRAKQGWGLKQSSPEVAGNSSISYNSELSQLVARKLGSCACLVKGRVCVCVHVHICMHVCT